VPQAILSLQFGRKQWEADVLAEEAQVAAGGKRIKSGRASSTDCPRAVRLLFLTGCRPQEIGDMKWSQLDLKAGELTIPAEIYKTGKHTKDIVIPLCDTAIEILRSVQRKPGREYVFGQIGNKGRSDTGAGAGLDLTHARDVIDRCIANVGAPAIDPAAELGVREMLAAGVPTYRIRSEAHVGWHTIKQIQARIEAGLPVAEPAQGRKLPHWQLRDIRRTFSTQLRSVPGVSREIVERLLGHLVGNKIERTYDKHEYWPEKRNAISKWDAYLHAIIDGTVQKIERPKFGLRSA